MERIPCPMKDTPHCPIYRQEGECYEDRHHIYWPSDEYSSRTEKAFRQLDENKVQICRFIHNTLHAVALPPEMPTVAVMREAIAREREIRN